MRSPSAQQGVKAVSPGFVNMLAHPEESLIVDGRGLSDLAQGVTLEVLGEDSMGPLTPAMKALALQRQSDIKFPITWTTLGQYMDGLEKKGISPNVASFVGEGTVRTNLLGENDVQPTPEQLTAMEGLVRAGDGGGGARPHHGADLRPQHLRQDARADRRWPRCRPAAAGSTSPISATRASGLIGGRSGDRSISPRPPARRPRSITSRRPGGTTGTSSIRRSP